MLEGFDVCSRTPLPLSNPNCDINAIRLNTNIWNKINLERKSDIKKKM